jgi:hypothetical protein
VGAAASLCVELGYQEMKKTRNRKVIYRGLWPGLGELYNIKVETGYTTIVVKTGEDLKKRAKETQAKFVRKNIALPASAGRGRETASAQTNRHHHHQAH